jgi:protein-L-isoaspartate(D-aspartate) O-methyltransferase
MAAMAGEAAAADGLKAMLRDIELEARLTAPEIGKERLAERVMAAMAKVPRQRFIPEPERYRAFDNRPLPIGCGQTISQPYIVALMTDLIEPQADSIVLEVGTGCGYQAAVLAGLVRHVYSVEIIGDLAEAARERLQRLGYDNVTVAHADGYLGWPEYAPFDGILVTAAAPSVPPALVEQLKPGGRMVIPVGPAGCIQNLSLIEKAGDGTSTRRDLLLVAFVPMTQSVR